MLERVIPQSGTAPTVHDSNLTYVRTSAAPTTRRWRDQRWLIDNIIQANGIDWDQPRSFYWSAPCGCEGAADFNEIRQKVRKYADASPAFEQIARRREAKANAALRAEALVTARDNFYIAAIHWGAAQWPLHETNDRNIYLNERKRSCYASYAGLADHTVEAAWIPLGDKALPAWFHLPPNYNGGRAPVVVNIPGMDSFKEAGVSLYADVHLSRGFAVLSIEGPGQFECPLLGIFVSLEAWLGTGKACMEWLSKRPEVDVQNVVIAGRSFGSFGATVAAVAEPRFKACGVSAVCHEPDWHTIFEQASPTFKMRFMYMSNLTDEERFDDFVKTLNWVGLTEKLKMPYLAMTGEHDELSALHNTERLLASLSGPKQLVVYEGARHSMGAGLSTNNGPMPSVLMADWFVNRVKDKPMSSERHFIGNAGNAVLTAF